MQVSGTVFGMIFGMIFAHMVVTLVGVLLLFLGSTVVFDAVHYALHRFAASRIAPLRALGELHAAHHAFMDQDLRIHEEHRAANIRRHVIPEFLTQLCVSALALLFLPAPVVLGAMALQGLVFALILRGRGEDINHHDIEVLPAYRPLYFCVPPYHALHHIHPDAYFSSYIKTLDHLLGTGLALRGRHVAITGADEGFGARMAALLEQRGGARVERVDRSPGVKPAGRQGSELGDARDEGGFDDAAISQRLAGVDILVLCHGEAALESDDEKAAGQRRDSCLRIIEIFRQLAVQRRFPPEVWVLDRETGGPGRAQQEGGQPFASHTRRYFLDPRLIYRHILLPAAEDMPRERAARIAFALLRSGLNYLPLRLTWENLRGYLAFARTPPAS